MSASLSLSLSAGHGGGSVPPGLQNLPIRVWNGMGGVGNLLLSLSLSCTASEAVDPVPLRTYATLVNGITLGSLLR